MNLLDAIQIIEDPQNDGIDFEDKVVEAWQFLIDTGCCWQLQGWYGRTAMYLLEQGICKKPEEQDNTKQIDPEYCGSCECTPCDCGYGSY